MEIRHHRVSALFDCPMNYRIIPLLKIIENDKTEDG